MSAIMGVLLAVAYKAPPGPVTIETIRRGCVGGIAPALALQGGALLGNLLLAGVAIIGVQMLVVDTRLALLVQLMGSGLLLYLGLAALRAPAIEESEQHVRPTPTSPLRGVTVGVMISLANPVALLFWFALSQRAAGVGGDPRSFLAGFTVGLAFASLGIALLAALAHQWLSPRLLLLTGRGCGLAMIAFGLQMGAGLLP